MILILLILIPFLAGIAAWFFSNRHASYSRWICLAGSAIDLVLVIWLWGMRSSAEANVYADLKVTWIPQLGITFHLTVDGLSLLLVALTALLGIASVVVSWTEIQERVGFFHFNLMTVIAGIIGVFLATDLILFYFFWEVMLVPMYFLIAIWGHEGRVYAALKFFIYTQVGSLFMLISIVGLYFMHGRLTGTYTFDYFQLLGTSLPPKVGFWLMLGFIAAFAVKLPVFLFHTWLPDAHTEAPTAGSVILAGLLLKTGGYGFIRFVLPLFPDSAAEIAPLALIFGAVAVIYGAVLALIQTDLKRLVAYTSVSHLGFVLVGVFALNEIAMQGAIVQMLAHGISTSALFMLVGMLQERLHTRELGRMGGLWSNAPIFGGITMVFSLASLGLPGMGNFVGEFLVLLGTYQTYPWIAVICAGGLVLSAIYSLWIMYRVFFGHNPIGRDVSDLSAREIAVMAVMIGAILWLGLFPNLVLRTSARINKSAFGPTPGDSVSWSQQLPKGLSGK